MSCRSKIAACTLAAGLFLANGPFYAETSSSAKYKVLASDDVGLNLSTVESYIKNGDQYFVRGDLGKARKEFDKARNMSKQLLGFYTDLSSSFKGIDAIQQAIDNKVAITGCTVHYVQKEVDSGSIIIQAAVPIDYKESKDNIKKRIQEMEHRILPLAIAIVAKKIRGEIKDKK